MKEKQLEIARDTITRNFIWDFKKGDNIIYNLKVLWVLYESRKKDKKNPKLFNKPITIIIISIIECILNDFVNRIQQRRGDPLPTITPRIISDFKYKKTGQTLEVKILKEFNHYIQQARKHNIFYKTSKFYDALDFLRKIRNKVHIQASSEDEDRIFTDKNLKLSEKVLEIVIQVMAEKYPRSHIPNFKVKDFPYPWKK